MTAVFKRELRSYFHTVRGYVFLSVFLLVAGLLTVYYGFLLEMPTLSYILSDMLMVSALLCPMLTYKSVYGDRRSGTDKLLYSLPLSSFEIALGKYFAILALYAIPTLLLATVPLIYNYFGEVNFLASYISLLAFFLFCATVTAINLFFSSLFKKPAFIFLSGYAFVAVSYAAQIISLWAEKQDILGGVLSKILYTIGVFNRFELFVYSISDFGAVVYYLALSVFFSLLVARSIEKRRLGGGSI